MNREAALAIVKQHLTEKRYLHTIGVTDTAIQLAEKYGSDIKKAEIAAIFHDYAKYRPENEMRSIIIEQDMPKDLLQFHSELWHAPVGAYLIQVEQGINDQEILNAVKYHTTGRAEMSLLEKIIYLADYIEPNRPDFPGLAEVRALAEKNLDQAVFQAVANSIAYLIKKQVPIYPDTIHMYNSFLLKKKDI